ncbi:MAG: ATP phosphoribosyltransferase regulatory subunit [Lachnospiraceae bacterium]|nr:ATP phosphoribosyltransferase regulatory subunit [Lachnospiraceae bacterium]
MAKNTLLHTPEGMRDIYGDEMEKKRITEERLLSLLHRYGFRDIATPTFEFIELFSKELSATSSRELYKFFDTDNRTLSLRPDFTPGIARAAVKYFEGSFPVRLCYLGNTFLNTHSLQGRLNEVTELGAEFMGEPSVEADAEMIALSSSLLQEAGLEDFEICIGHEGFFKGLCEEAGADPESAGALKEHLLDKNYFGLSDLLTGLNLPEGLRKVFDSFPEFIGGREILEHPLLSGVPDRSLKALKRLKDLCECLSLYGIEKKVSFDLGMLSAHNYYTGVLFRAFTFGTGEPIVRGGRYDDLLKKFGKDRAAIGFTLVIDQLLETLRHLKKDIPIPDDGTLIVSDREHFPEALTAAEKIRRENGRAELLCRTGSVPDKALCEAYARSTHAGKILYFFKD